MRTAVYNIWPSFVARFEGRLGFMYLDTLGYVTTGIGNKIDPLSEAMGYPWTVNGRAASADEIACSWNAVKARTDLEPGGGAHFASVPGNIVRLTDSGIDAVVDQALRGFDNSLTSFFGGAYVNAPADAQLGVCSMVWAMGMGNLQRQFPKFNAAFRLGDYSTCADECHMSNGAPARNAANVALFQAAAQVLAQGLDPNQLYGVSSSGIVNAATDAAANVSFAASAPAAKTGLGLLALGSLGSIGYVLWKTFFK